MGITATASSPSSKSRRARRPRRLLLFVHYNKWGNLADYVVYLLKRVRKVYARIVFISNSPLSEEARRIVAGLCDEVRERENTGFDFYAWKVALDHEGPEGLARHDSVTLMNDTCFGPLFELEAVHREMEARGADFWGLTNHREELGDDPLATDGRIPEHIQSYFLCFNKKTALSAPFADFWRAVEPETGVEACIRKYETQLTPYLCRHGFKPAVLCDAAREEAEVSNVTTQEPGYLLQKKNPLLKVKAFFTYNPPETRYLFPLIRQHSRYPVSLIRDHLGRLVSPEVSVHIVSHDLPKKKRARAKPPRQRIAIHIHVFYPDILRQILTRITERLRARADIFLTTDSEAKAAECREMLAKEFPGLNLRKLVVCENLGRDVWPWLQVAPELAGYDMACHLHTKKAPTANRLFGELWLDELLESLLDRFEDIEDAFARQPGLGIVIPDIPSGFRFPPLPYSYEQDQDMKKLLPKVWARIGCTREVDFPNLSMLVFSYGNMFWYRPAALAPLWQTPWARRDIPEEPLPTNGTLLHALERLPVYVAWDQGYDYRISRQLETQPSGFQNERAFGEYRRLHAQAASRSTKPATLELLRAKMRRRLSPK